MIIISIKQQKLTQCRRSGIRKTYHISTGKAGSGNNRDSGQTPLGRHRIAQLIGAGMPLNTVFKARKAVGFYNNYLLENDDDKQKDWILGRILWLAGDQLGINRRGQVDTFKRYIYLHGTDAEDKLGQAISHGCIRMACKDIEQVFCHSFIGEKVYIRSA
ncbi:MAG: L,D-transpeptidase [Mariprofundales bacterium]